MPNLCPPNTWSTKRSNGCPIQVVHRCWSNSLAFVGRAATGCLIETDHWDAQHEPKHTAAVKTALISTLIPTIFQCAVS